MRKFKEFLIEKLILICGLASIFFVVLIFLFLLKEGLAVFKSVSPAKFLLGSKWYPISEPPQLGILPLIMGSLLVTLGAAVISIPIGVASAIYIAEVAPAKLKEILKAGIELLAAIPSVVLGFIGMVTLVPWVKTIFHLPTGLTALSGSIMLAFMAMPTIVSIAEDALYSIPKSYKEGALALGATRWQAIWRVMLPAIRQGHRRNNGGYDDYRKRRRFTAQHFAAGANTNGDNRSGNGRSGSWKRTLFCFVCNRYSSVYYKFRN